MSRYSNDLIQFDIKENKSLLNREFILITLSSFIFFFNFHSFLLFPIRIQELGGSTSTIGFIMGATGLSTIFTTPAVGILVDRCGKKRFLATGGLIMSLTTLPFAYLDTLNFLFPLLRIIQGAAFSLCFISAGTLIADVTPVLRRSQALGLFGVFTIVNYALAPYFGKLIIETYSFKVFFLVFFRSDVTPVLRRSQALGLFGVFTIVNYALAPYFGKLIIETYSFKVFFLVFFFF